MQALNRLARGLPSLLILAWLSLATPAVQAWDGATHRAIADLAQSRLSASARPVLADVLAADGAQALADVSTWADEHRTPITGRWHYVNFARFEPGCDFDARKHCPDGQCIVTALERQIAALADRASGIDARMRALRYVVHLVADVHQPLHAGFDDDRGGNTFQLQWAGRGTNLHALWDHGLGASRPGGIPGIVRELAPRTSPPQAQGRPTDWAEASCTIVRRPDFYPGRRPSESSYAAAMDTILIEQIDLAAWRLAGVLEQALSARPQAVSEAVPASRFAGP